MPHVLTPWRRRRRCQRPEGLRRVGVPEPLEGRVLLCADHAGLAGEPLAGVAPAGSAAIEVAAAAPSASLTPAPGGPGLQAVVGAGFTEQQIATGITSPTAIEVGPDGRIFVSEQTGNVRVIKNGQLLATPFLTVNEDSYFERGLFGMTFDPNFATNGFVYVYYTALLPGRSPGAPDDPQRVSRFTVNPANPDVVVPGSELVLYETEGVATAQWHSGGAIDFGPDGKLYFAVGEAQQPSKAQSLDSALGKILRINPDGTIPTDNPFYNQATGANRAIWAMGLRNPFTAAFQPGTGRYYINDVGQDLWEEINEGFAGANFGWPGTEGAFPQNQHLNYTNPTHAYPHSQGCSISGGAFYNPTNNLFPAEYTGKYFFGDFCGGWIRTFDPETKAVTTFATGVQSNVGITIGNDGALYYISRGSGFGGLPNTGSVYKISYNVGQPPTLSAQPQDVLVSAGESASFSVSASGSGPFTYQWQRASGPSGTFANIGGATGATYTINTTALADNDARFRVVVTDAANRTTTSNAAVLAVTSNRRPSAAISAPGGGSTYGGGQVINFSGGGVDNEDGTLPPSALTWRVDFHHADHVHPYLPDSTGSATGSFTVPTESHGATNVYYRITLTVKDSGGLTRSTFRDVTPRLSTVTVEADAPGLRVLVGSQPFPAPYAFQGIEGQTYALEAPTTQFANNNVYQFASWSNGGTQAQTFTTPVDDVTVRARYREVESAGIYIEGESGTFVAPMNSFNAAGASGGQNAGSLSANAPTVDNPGTAGGTATYNFAVPADGVYAFWARGLAPGEFDDSFWFRIDNGQWWLWDMPNNPNYTWDQIGNRQPGGGPAPGSATLANLTAGNHTITLRVREDGARVDQFLVTRDTAFVPAAGSTGDATAPRVEQVYVAGSNWAPEFTAALGGVGYAIPGGSTASQLASLPWTNLNQVKVKFSEAMNAATIQSAAAGIVGAAAAANYPLTFSGYDAASRIATWTLANNATFAAADRLRLVLPHTIADTAGTRLDGNWTTGQAYASGNSVAGGLFDFRFNVVPGDGNRSSGTTSSDLIAVRNRQNTTLAEPGTSPNTYDVMFDVNGSGTITSSDLIAVRNLQNTELPPAEPPAASTFSIATPISAASTSPFARRTTRTAWPTLAAPASDVLTAPIAARPVVREELRRST